MILIPARLKSTRFPEKMLAFLGSAPLIVQTARNAIAADIAPVVVACDDEKILRACHDFGVRVVKTGSHETGTDRCAEAARILGLADDEVILNVQGDEPFVESEILKTLYELAKSAEFFASLAKKLTEKSQILNPNIAKLVLNAQNEAIFFSRSVLPFCRDFENGIGETQYFSHLGLYGFRNRALQEFSRLKKTAIEDLEKLEQLRAIYHKKSIKIAVVQTQTIGIDTPEDLVCAQKRLESLDPKTR